MMKEKMAIRLAILFLFLGVTMAKHHKTEPSSEEHAETKVKPRFSGSYKAPHTYLYEEDDHHPSSHGHQGGDEYVDSEEQKVHKEQEESQGNENSDKTVKDDEYNDHSEKGGHQEFEAGGLSFDKHLKDHKADNKEIENVKGHDAGEKFGGEAVKEHKNGKHKEKSKGHKLNGFKNVYHKEEYGDHKVFHDEFLDSDHLHNYDEDHEHKEMQGGKFSKGYKHDGKSKKYDKGDEKREWGKEEFDSQREGKHEKGGQSSKQRHGSKKHQGHYDANRQKQKHSIRKVKKGTPPPPLPHVGHHGPHQAQIQPYVSSHYNPHHQQVDVPSHYKPQDHQEVDAPTHHYKPHAHQQVHPVQYDDDQDKNHGSQYNNHDDQHSSHNGHAHNHGGHHDHDSQSEYSDDDDDRHDDHDGHYHERVAHNYPRKSLVKERLVDKSDDKIIHKHEPVALKQSVSPHVGIQQYRQPVYQEQPLYKQPEYVRQEKVYHPFEDKFQNRQHAVRYGYQQPRYHHRHHQPHHHQRHQHQQPFPRFSSLTHHHLGHPHHGSAHKHFRHVPSYEEKVKPDIFPRKVVFTAKPEQNERHPQLSQKQYQ